MPGPLCRRTKCSRPSPPSGRRRSAGLPYPGVPVGCLSSLAHEPFPGGLPAPPPTAICRPGSRLWQTLSADLNCAELESSPRERARLNSPLDAGSGNSGSP